MAFLYTETRSHREGLEQRLRARLEELKRKSAALVLYSEPLVHVA